MTAVITCRKVRRVDGAIAMNGSSTLGNEAGGGSGVNWSGNGGGGRIAIYCNRPDQK